MREAGPGRGAPTMEDRVAARMTRTRPRTWKAVGRALLAGAGAGMALVVLAPAGGVARPEAAQVAGVVLVGVCLLFRTMAYLLERMADASRGEGAEEVRRER